MSELNSKKAPFRADVVGSYLRPDYLKEARENYNNGVITDKELKTVEDRAITDLVNKQKEIGLSVITDGEFRRSWWHLDFMWGLNGIDKTVAQQGYVFKDEVTRGDSAVVTGKISGENHPFVEHFKFIKALEDENVVARQTIPAPAQLLAEIQRDNNLIELKKFYKEDEELFKDIAAAYRRVILDLYEAGCRNVQLDDCSWGLLCDKETFNLVFGKDASVEEIAKCYIDLNNAAIENLPKDLVVTTHVCRGNYHSTWALSGGYAPIAPFLFAKENVQAYYLEFDDDRSGDFEPLKHISEDEKVVLGLITSKKPQLEDKEVIIKRIKEATKYIPLERLYLSPQCGFASTEEGNILTEDEQWRKIGLVIEVAKEVWG